ncbi:MAG: ImmA/IrrE family metallo-endopeptidase [Atopobiaceae bacterium]|nr:ImmA/IrrE family metallo-endopeptidase [Atopobiaceae bacterium]
MKFLEFALPMLFPDFELEILTMEEMGEKHGETLPDKHIIRIREDIYDRACAGKGRDRFTVCHEMGHLFMHAHLDVSMARTRGSYPAYESSEWQANAFAGELLMPHDAIVGMDIREVADRFMVSESAAEKQLRS